MKVDLNPQQQAIVEEPTNVLITACPGSGKTRVLTHRIIRELDELASTKHRVIALTFTNRAADEIKSRLDRDDISVEYLWAGTIHAFSLEWILRPYACYCDRIKNGFSVADEFYTEKLLNSLKEKYDVPRFQRVNTRPWIDDQAACFSDIERTIRTEYQDHLSQNRLIDYDLVLYLTRKMEIEHPEICRTLGSFIRLFCVDEYQDTQELQYNILGNIVKHSNGFTNVFIVGDCDQAIYTSLGGIAKSHEDIAEEFELDSIVQKQLTGNYRSTQRIIDYYLNFQNTGGQISSLTKYAEEEGLITFSNQTHGKEDVPEMISGLIQQSLDAAVPEHEICVVAPRWELITSLGRRLVSLLPDVKFDAPGLSPFSGLRENVWFKMARLFLTEPEPNMYLTRLRWTGDIIRDLREHTGRELKDEYSKPRRFLRLKNSLESNEAEGVLFLEDVFDQLMESLSIDVDYHPSLLESKNTFFEKAEARINNPQYSIPSGVTDLKRMFRRPNGVVVNTCHGIKGEEYETVICFGLLKGYIPHWDVIINGTDSAADSEARKLLYVIASRAKRQLHLIAEYGRMTRGQRLYETNPQLQSVRFQYDPGS